jgi:hypothetical protein
MNEHSHKWMKPLVSMLLLGSMAIFSGCGGSDNNTAAVAVESRTDLAHAGEAEFPTGIHYGNTLFDSADKKCQMCHFELYDTWKSSMHAKSWTDGIFQSKYQDYLRIQLSNIEKDTAATGNDGSYGMNTITGAPIVDGLTSSSTLRTQAGGGSSKVCIKCHAPSAYYAGDFNITVTKISSGHADINTSVLAALKSANQSNLAGTGFTTDNPTTVAAVGKNGNLYTATYHIGHVANREGINCATCHSVESIRLMGEAGTSGLDGVRDDGTYTLAKDLSYGPNKTVRYAAGTVLSYDKNASNPHMNGFFSLVGPDVFSNVTDTPQDASMNTAGKVSDGRFTLRSVELNGTASKTHYTGGPFYGPYGITGTANSNTDDDSNRSATSLGEHVFQANDNHFSKNAKALCLSCHQRSAGALDPNTSDLDGFGKNQMELCSTWNGMTSGTDNNWADTASSPKCTKCHMPRLSDKTVLHKWNKPNELFQRDELLTGYFDPADGDGYGETHNPVVGKWMNDHGFIGANKLTGKTVPGSTNWKEKIQSGFDADLTASISSDVLTVDTSLLNKTAHMFPGAHPMRRVLTRVIVTDSTGAMVPYTTATGNSTFENITNTVVPSEIGSTVNKTGTGRGSVSVEYDSNRVVEITGLQADLNGSAVESQRFDATSLIIAGADSTLKDLHVVAGTTKGTAAAVNIIDDTNASTFTRVYGRETGKKYDATSGALDNVSGTFVVRPGFDSNTVPFDNRLVPNEKENYTVTYDVTGKSGITVTYKVYYMLTGANGVFPTGTDGWHNGDSATNRVDEVFTKTVTP